MQRSRIEALQNAPMFGAVGDEVVELVVELASVVDLASGEYFFRQGERGSSAFLLEQGDVDILKSWEGSEYRLGKLSEGDCFGEVALLDFGARSASVRASSDCRALEIGARDLHQVAKKDPGQFALIYMNLARELSRRLRAAADRLFRVRFETTRAVEGHDYAAM
ncbi:MAG: Crp/Fnr family transcriptional regulator [Deltaproteobacteria bacterium]|nr:Crp/Fnr family transcriptional regulator [Deltaproteobacteria bacterium]